MRNAHINNLNLFKITVFFVNNLFSVQLKQENTKYNCFTTGPSIMILVCKLYTSYWTHPKNILKMLKTFLFTTCGQNLVLRLLTVLKLLFFKLILTLLPDLRYFPISYVVFAVKRPYSLFWFFAFFSIFKWPQVLNRLSNFNK